MVMDTTSTLIKGSYHDDPWSLFGNGYEQPQGFGNNLDFEELPLDPLNTLYDFNTATVNLAELEPQLLPESKQSATTNTMNNPATTTSTNSIHNLPALLKEDSSSPSHPPSDQSFTIFNSYNPSYYATSNNMLQHDKRDGQLGKSPRSLTLDLNSAGKSLSASEKSAKSPKVKSKPGAFYATLVNRAEFARSFPMALSPQLAAAAIEWNSMASPQLGVSEAAQFANSNLYNPSLAYDPHAWMHPQALRERNRFSPHLLANGNIRNVNSFDPSLFLSGAYGQVAPTIPFIPNFVNRPMNYKLPVSPAKPSGSFSHPSQNEKTNPLVLPTYIDQSNKLMSQGPQLEGISTKSFPPKLSAALGLVDNDGLASDNKTESILDETSQKYNNLLVEPIHHSGNTNNVANTASMTENWMTEMQQTKDMFLREALAIDFDNVTVIEMKKLLRKFSLNAMGKKKVLEDRIRFLIEHYQSK